jgi:chromosomal replication initiation ATPase DnaA
MKINKNAFELVNSGQNMIICGQAGVGKTHLVKHIVQYKRKEQKHLFVVCSTGIVVLEDGRHLNEELLHLIKTDERFLHVKANIECTDLLIIDEVSMISTKVLNQLEFVCIHVRKSDSYFGNMQVVLVGDFYQLWK